MLSRKTLCLASEAPGFTLHDGDDQFLRLVSNHYSAAENDAAEKLMKLKRTVASLPADRFWRVLLPGIADILKAEYITIAKRILEDDPNSVVEMPAIGEPGSCFNAVALYVNDGKTEDLFTDYSYLTYGGACAQMRYDKVFLVPSALAMYMPTRVAEFKVIPESYIGIPLFYEDKCFGHIACIWSDVSTFKDSGLTWGFTEMILHALEDVVSAKLLEGTTLQPPSPAIKSRQVIPQAAVMATQSLKPYARSLSHELRTPMQTMVGGMDLIGATLEEVLCTTSLEDALKQVRKARELIADFQDSSRRAVRAADNVVQAYDLDMQIPDGPMLLEDDLDEPSASASPLAVEISSSNYANFTAKRKRDVSEQRERMPKARSRSRSQRLSVTDSAISASQQLHPSIEIGLETPGDTDSTAPQETSPTTPTVGAVQIRDFVKSEVSDLISNFESRPTSLQIQPHDLGETISFTTVSPSSTPIRKHLEWEVHPLVPSEIVIEEKELSKTFTAIIANALKFTTDTGFIKIDIRLSPKSRYVVFTVTDNGCGIPQSFQPRLFQAFSREDESITRQNEGLGLGLLVAKGNARKIGGDLLLIRSATEGPDRGSKFELKIPVSPFDTDSRHENSSRPGTPGHLEIPPTPLDLENAPTSAFRPQATPLKLSLDHQQGIAITPAQLLTPGSPTERPRPMVSKSLAKSNLKQSFDKELGKKYPHKILVAEDSSLNRKLVVAMLTKLGYTHIAEAFDGREAVRLMEDASIHNDQIDIILMDLWMPNMDGYEAAQRILAMQKDQRSRIKKDLKILAVTADITDTALERAKEVGMAGYMTKPFKVVDLERLIIEHSHQPVAVV
ncbi:MAG: hypothetical protein GOMPHAMPRED_002754 [Gomphillus americanus]|uniref:histidine kinase n=1 Tax=Gomphillus americanus TaxID=1940652 RepID=A0A8H3FEM4_9LECA|nr:MAG: hypothetical protein GOMPHAMPRED_002754 [Gomphillus americanus]